MFRQGLPIRIAPNFLHKVRALLDDHNLRTGVRSGTTGRFGFLGIQCRPRGGPIMLRGGAV